MTDLANPVYCRQCREQIQADATFCPKCGWDQRNFPGTGKPTEPVVIEAQVIAEAPSATTVAPQPQAPQQAPQPVIYVQQANSNRSGAGTALAAVGLMALLLPPIGCFTIPVLVLALLGVLLAGLAAIPTILGIGIGLIARFIAVRFLPEEKRQYANWLLVLCSILGVAVNFTFMFAARNAAPAPTPTIPTSRTYAPPAAPATPATSVASTQATQVPPRAPESVDPYVSAVGRIQAGVVVYYRDSPGAQADPWFTVLVPYIENGDHPLMRVQYSGTGRIEEVDRRAILRSQAANNGQLVIRR